MLNLHLCVSRSGVLGFDLNFACESPVNAPTLRGFVSKMPAILRVSSLAAVPALAAAFALHSGGSAGRPQVCDPRVLIARRPLAPPLAPPLLTSSIHLRSSPRALICLMMLETRGGG